MTKERKSTRKTTNNLVEADRKERLKQTGLPLSIKKKKNRLTSDEHHRNILPFIYIYIYRGIKRSNTSERERERERERQDSDMDKNGRVIHRDVSSACLMCHFGTFCSLFLFFS